MKTLFLWMTIVTLTQAICRKPANWNMLSVRAAIGNWKLLKADRSQGRAGFATTQSSGNSSIMLVLNADNTYFTTLNDKIISQDRFSISPDTLDLSRQILRLNKLKPTGIFTPFMPDRQVLYFSYL